MTFPGTISKIQYLAQKNLKSEQELQRHWYREAIQQFGVPAVYFRHDSNYNQLLTTIYGETPDLDYATSADINIFVEANNDVILLSKFGLTTETDIIIHILKEDFYEQFRDSFGELTAVTVTDLLTSNISNSAFIVSSYITDSYDLTATISGIVNNLTNNSTITGSFMPDVSRTPHLYHWLIYKSEAYATRYLSGNVTATYTATTDISGSGTATTQLNGQVLYFTNSDKTNGPKWGVSPKVGDFFRLEFDTDFNNNEEYEITKVNDKQLSDLSLNTLLSRYCYRINAVRRDPSHEHVSASPQKEEQNVGNTKTELSNAMEDSSNNIFDYETTTDTNLLSASSVYGGYNEEKGT